MGAHSPFWLFILLSKKRSNCVLWCCIFFSHNYSSNVLALKHVGDFHCNQTIKVWQTHKMEAAHKLPSWYQFQEMCSYVLKFMHEEWTNVNLYHFYFLKGQDLGLRQVVISTSPAWKESSLKGMYQWSVEVFNCQD